jgi:hypothetical protein
MKKISDVIADQSTLFKVTGLTVVPKSLRAPKPKGTKRNYREEEEDSQLALFNVMADYRVQRNSGISPRLVQIAKALILCGLPYRSTTETRIERMTREADGTFVRVTFYALARDLKGDPIPMPFGSDRTLLHFGIDRAIKLKSSFVSIDNPTEYLLALGKTLSGANYTALRESVRRLSGLSVVVERFAPGKSGHDETRQTLPVLEAAYIPSRLEKDNDTSKSPEMPCGLRFGEHFFNEINQHHVPFPWELLCKLSAKPQIQDIILNLHRRSFACKTTTTVTWEHLRNQMWHDDSNRCRIRERFQKAIVLLKTAWPELNAEARSRGLLIGPPHGGKHLFDPYLPETKYLDAASQPD